MDNLQITTLVGDALVTIRHCFRTGRWRGTRARDGQVTDWYRDLRDLAEDIEDAGHLDAFWRSDLLADDGRTMDAPRVVRFAA